MNGRVLSLAAVLLFALAPSLHAEGKFVSVHGDDIAYGHYRVTVAGSVPDAEISSLAAELARIHGGRLEPYAETGFHGFAIILRPAAARLLSGDPRVAGVEERVTAERLPRNAAPAIVRSIPAPAALPIASTSSVTEPWSGIYHYDGAGNTTAIGDNRYAYDAASRLISATAITGTTQNLTQSYAYDAFGNRLRTSVNDGTTPVQVAGVDSFTNRMDRSDLCAAGTTCMFGAFDEAGNQVSANATSTYQYDATNVMTELQAPGRHDLYVYDADDERVAVVSYADASTQTWRFTLRSVDANVVREAVETVSGGNATWKWTKDHVHRGGSLIAVIEPGPGGGESRIHFHLDHLTTPRLLTDDAGRKLAMHTYWPFGVQAGGDQDAETIAFAGRERDGAENDAGALDYVHARYLSSNAARFLAIDRAKPHPETPQSLNRYAYVQNNPTRYIDVDGNLRVVALALNIAEPGKPVPFDGKSQAYRYKVTFHTDDDFVKEAVLKAMAKQEGDAIADAVKFAEKFSSKLGKLGNFLNGSGASTEAKDAFPHALSADASEMNFESHVFVEFVSELGNGNIGEGISRAYGVQSDGSLDKQQMDVLQNAINAVAHGNEDAASIEKAYDVSDLEKTAEESSKKHWYSAFVEWLDRTCK